MDSLVFASVVPPLSKLAARDESFALLILLGVGGFIAYRAWKNRDKS